MHYKWPLLNEETEKKTFRQKKAVLIARNAKWELAFGKLLVNHYAKLALAAFWNLQSCGGTNDASPKLLYEVINHFARGSYVFPRGIQGDFTPTPSIVKI